MPQRTLDEILQQELDAAHAGVHQRQKGEEKRLLALKQQKLKRAEQLRNFRVAAVDGRFEEQKREVCISHFQNEFSWLNAHNPRKRAVRTWNTR